MFSHWILPSYVVTTATVFNAYVEEKKRSSSEKNKIRKILVRSAFLRVKNENNKVDRTTLFCLFKILNDECPDIKYIRSETAELIFDFLDEDHSNDLDETEFLNLTNALFYEFEVADGYKTGMETYFPNIFFSGSYQKFADFVKSQNFEIFIDVIIALNVIVCLLQTWEVVSNDNISKLDNDETDTFYEVIEIGFTILYFFEMCAKLLVLGYRSYIESSRNKFDGFITVAAVLVSIYVYYPNGYDNRSLIRMLMMARVLRLLRLLYNMKEFRVVLQTLEAILPDMGKILRMLLFIWYIFSVVGMRLFGGLITRNPNDYHSELLVGTDFETGGYWANSFNDMMSGVNVLFNLLVVNNWTTEADGIVAVTETKYSRFYFLAYHIIAVVIVGNIVIASIIDNFFNFSNEEATALKSRKSINLRDRKYKLNQKSRRTFFVNSFNSN